MQVSPNQPFRIIYSLYQHEYLGYLFESFAIQLDAHGNLSLQNQNISAANADEFCSGIDEVDRELIKLMDSMQQDAVIYHFQRKKTKPDEFFKKVFGSDNKTLQTEIHNYLERRRAKILQLLLKDKLLYEMGNDGEPAWKKIDVQQAPATVLFHFRRNEDNTHYFPTIKQDGEKVDFQYNGSILICHKPAWLYLKGNLYHFEKELDGNKLSPFLNKKFIVIPKKVEETYYQKFVTALLEQHDVFARGFEIETLKPAPEPVLTFSSLASVQKDLFDEDTANEGPEERILFDLSFQYSRFSFGHNGNKPVTVRMEKEGDNYHFYRVSRNIDLEKQLKNFLVSRGLNIQNGRTDMPATRAFSWLSENLDTLKAEGYILRQETNAKKKYFVGQPQISFDIRENIDWFDIHAIVKFGEYEIPFSVLRKSIINESYNIDLPNGEIAVIPESWIEKFSDLISFTSEKEGVVTLKKHHLALVHEIKEGNIAKVSIDRKLEKLRTFETIEDQLLPSAFHGELRPYQKAGFNWMHFLRSYNFGGCLADDMGLGKTVQTLAMLQGVHDETPDAPASLLVMPTSLIYNWELEAAKFTPELKVFSYTGTNRNKNCEQFNDYDLVITSYGILRLDIDIIKNYYFNYIILDESQAIKNPESIISKSVRELASKHKLILSGTPIENNTMDLWSQMSFINPGLLGTQKFFRKHYQIPIEKKGDTTRLEKLSALIKPFILRRNKMQVASELPEKVEQIQFCTMTEPQRKEYESVKEYYRNNILEHIESHGINKSQFMVLQGLTKLRQIANHPAMVDESYQGDSGKMEELSYMIENTLVDDHKILIFSQFVKHLGLVRAYLDQKGYQYSYLDGSTKNRQKEVEDFQHDPDKKLFLISLKAGGLGLNLTQADYVFLLDPWWNPAIEAQAVDRAHRIGQNRHVFTYRFITKETVEEKIQKLQKHKLSLAESLVSTEDKFVKSLSKEDIESIFN